MRHILENYRVSVNQIIWGGNYFIDYLSNTRCFIIWDKQQPEGVSLQVVNLHGHLLIKVQKLFI